MAADVQNIDHVIPFEGGVVSDDVITKRLNYDMENLINRPGSPRGLRVREGITPFGDELEPSLGTGQALYFMTMPNRRDARLVVSVNRSTGQVENIWDYIEQEGRIPPLPVRGQGDTPISYGPLPCVHENYICVVLYSILYNVTVYHYLELSVSATLSDWVFRVTDDILAAVSKSGATITIDFFSLEQMIKQGGAYSLGAGEPQVMAPYKTISWTESSGSNIIQCLVASNDRFYLITEELPGQAVVAVGNKVRVNRVNTSTLAYISTTLITMTAPSSSFEQSATTLAASLPDIDGNFIYVYQNIAVVGTDFNYFAVKINPASGAVVAGPLAMFNTVYQADRPYSAVIPLENGKYAWSFGTVDEGGVSVIARDRLAVISADLSTITELDDFGGADSKGRFGLRHGGGLDDTIFLWNFVDNTIEKVTSASTAPVVTTFYSPASDLIPVDGHPDSFGRMNSLYLYGGPILIGIDGTVYQSGVYADYYGAESINSCAGQSMSFGGDAYGWYRTSFAGAAT